MIENYWWMHRSVRTRQFSVTPDGYVEVLFWADPVHVVEGDRRIQLPSCTVIGLLTRPLQLELPGTVRCASARLHCWAKRLLVGATTPGAPWCDGGPRFAAVLPQIVSAVVEGRGDDVCRLLDAEFLPRLGKNEEAFAHARAIVVPGETARRLERRQVERRVKSETGTSPKQLASLLRFQRARDRLWSSPETPLDELALGLGYADQPHLQRDFKRYAGMTPRAFVREQRRLSEELTVEARNVANLQEIDDRTTQG